MSKGKLINSIVDTIKAWQGDDGEIDVDNGNINNFIEELIADIERNYKEVDTTKIDEALKNAYTEYKELKELGASELAYLEGKMMGFKIAKQIIN